MAAPTCDGTWGAGLLVVDERVAGAERLTAQLSRGPARSQADFGDPLVAAGTRYTLCFYDDAEALIGRIEVDRAGDTCGNAACWKGVAGSPPRGRGYRYRDTALAADGVQLFRLRGAGAGRSKLLLRARNDAGAGHTNLPLGLAAALAGSTSATLKLFGSDATPCASATLGTVLGGSATVFRAER